MIPSAAATAVLLIAHGSRRPEANDDLDYLAEQLRERGCYSFVQPSFLELSSPTIAEGAAACVAAGAQCVVMLPYFLAPGIHACDDMLTARAELAARFPDVEFLLAQPLGRHPLLVEVVLQRAEEAAS
jgi:sirohydrochlorin ferrochelatase